MSLNVGGDSYHDPDTGFYFKDSSALRDREARASAMNLRKR